MRSGFITRYVFKNKSFKDFSIKDCVTYPRVGETILIHTREFVVYKVHPEPLDGFVHVHIVETKDDE